MTIIDRIILLLTGLIAIYLIWFFIGRQKNPSTAAPLNIYGIAAFAVFLVAGLLLIFLGWEILGLLGGGSQKSLFVAVVAGLIPFSLATGLVSKFYPKFEKPYLGLMILGVVLIALTKYAGLVTFGKIVYPLFHATAGLTIFFIPIIAVKAGKAKSSFINVTIGGTLIGLGGIALGFLTAGKQLLFFSGEFVLMILAPLLFFTALFFALGLIKMDS
jgi:hypothetical protein